MSDNSNKSNGRPKKHSRKSSTSTRVSGDEMSATSTSLMVMDPSIDSPGTYAELMTSADSTNGSPAKVDDVGEICALCNCGSEMALILGQITQYSVSTSTVKKLDKFKNDISKEKSSNLEITSSDTLKRESKEKVFYKRRRRKPHNDSDSNLPPDMTTFGTSQMQEFTDVLDNNGCLWAHHCCAAWSNGVCQTDSYDLENVDRAVAKALLKKCSHCQRYGASVECQVHRCNKLYHYPCCASAGAFQNITSVILLCPDHLDRTEKIADAGAFCDACEKSENMNLQLFCTSCGRHFHSYCADMTIPITPVVRMGWQCSFCKVCQGCKQPGDEDKMLCCDHCDKGYHIYCLNPPISAVPKSTWKCVSCRKCDDCGSTRAGGGPSCRWHNNFTLCDRCYQQRKKGQCCPLCNRAIRLFNNIDVLQCTKCFKCVHGECDPDGAENKKYVCSMCLKNPLSEQLALDVKEENVDDTSYDIDATGQITISMEQAQLFSMAASADFISTCDNTHPVDEDKLDSGDDFYNFKIADDKMSESTFDSPYNSSVMSESINEPSQYNRKKTVPLFKRKSFRGRGYRASTAMYNTMSSQDESIKQITQPSDCQVVLTKLTGLPNELNDDDDDDDDEGNENEAEAETGLHSTVVIVSTKDSYTLKQDICMCCGSLGKGKDGYLIGCVQCGQCFHPYCVNVKINEVILDRGWRCLDCTVCEGCGRNADEAHLLLCDICDVSFHTYCLVPPLQEVPVGGWKCQWCAVCEDCGSKDAGFNCLWMANYSQCGPCSSEQYCSICSYAYEANNLVIQCEKCNRWLHGECDGLYCESDATLACSMTYHCSQCRPITKHIGIYSSLKTSIVSKVIKKAMTNSLLNQNNQNVKKTKTLHNIKVKKLTKLEIKEQKRAELEAMPLIPENVVTDECGTFRIDLGLLKGRLRMDDIAKPSFHLTDTGMKQIKSQVIRAPIQRTVRKPRKNDESAKNLAIMSEEVSCSIDGPGEDTNHEQEGNDHHYDGEHLGGDGDILSPDLIKQEDMGMDGDIMQPDTTDDMLVDDGNDIMDPEDVTDPFEFFGVNLLERQLHMEIESEATISSRKKMKKEKRKEKRMRKAARLAEEARLAFDTLRGPSVPDPTAIVVHISRESYPTQTTPLKVTPSSIEEEPLPVTHIKEELIVSPTSSIVSTSSIQMPNTKISVSTVSDISNDPTLDLLNVQDLPHVEGHEVEQLFAGIEQDRIVPSIDGIVPTIDGMVPTIDGMEPTIDGIAPTIDEKLLKDNLPSASLEPTSSAVTYHSQLMYENTIDELAKINPSPMLSGQALMSPGNSAPMISGQALMSPGNSAADAFKVVFGDDSNDALNITGSGGKKTVGLSYPKIDTQKQLKKWEQDEKLGEDATISPVLYANLVHKNLVNEFKDWASRARAIARLWRKLPSDQREPFRLRARDNRVKKKGAKQTAAQQQASSSITSTPHKEQSTNNNLTTNQNPMLPPPPVLTPDESVTSPIQKIFHTNTTPKTDRKETTILTVSEPQKLSPLLHNLSPSFSMSSISGITPTTPSSPFILNTPTTPVADGQTPNKTTSKEGVIKPAKPKKPKLTKEQKEQKKMQKKMQAAVLLEKEKQWKLLQTQRLFEQQRLAILKTGGKPMDSHLLHPSVRFANANSTSPLNPSFPDDPMQQLIEKMQSEQAKALNPPSREFTNTIVSASSQIHTTDVSSTVGNKAIVISEPISSTAHLTRVNTVGESTSVIQNSPPKAPHLEVPLTDKNTDNSEFEKRKMDAQSHSEFEMIRSNMEMQHSLENEMFLRGAPGSSIDHNAIRKAEQHQSYLMHQQQYMASQQQYIQWQLAQQQQQQLYGKAKGHGKEGLPEIDSEEKHQERIRFLYQQRQFSKDPAAIYSMPQSSAPSALVQSVPPNKPLTSHSTQPQPVIQQSHSTQHQPVIQQSNSTQPQPVIQQSKQINNEIPTQLTTDKTNISSAGGAISHPQVSQSPQVPNQQQSLTNPHVYGETSNMGYPPSFQSMNTPEAAMYHQMVMEYMRCRKGYEGDPNIPPSMQFYNNMAEIAKQYYQRHGNYAGKGYPPTGPPAQSPMYPPYPPVHPSERNFYDDRGYPKADYNPTPQSHYYPRAPSMHSASPRLPSNTSPSIDVNRGLYSKSKPMLQKSASFEISRIPADSTSNDEILQDTINREQSRSEPYHAPSQSGIAQNENEISSSKVNDSHDEEDSSCGHNATTTDHNTSRAEHENRETVTALSKSTPCTDGIHCGTDDEDDETSSQQKKDVCTDGIHCGTDDEDDENLSKQKKVACTDGIHCGTDNEDDENLSKQKKNVCTDGIHCGTDDEDDETSSQQKKDVCTDGIHCGTDDEGDQNSPQQKKGACTDGIHCGTDDEGDQNSSQQKKGACTDGIHCGTDDEGDQNLPQQKKGACTDGIHCGTDDEDDENLSKQKKVACTDGIHCGTDDEDDENLSKRKKGACTDGIHCGTDDEDDENLSHQKKDVCTDGINCGTDDEDDETSSQQKKVACTDGFHCGTDDEDDQTSAQQKKNVCTDGIHCGTDDEDDQNLSRQNKGACTDGIHCGTDDEDDETSSQQKKNVCTDGIHCGTDDEDDQNSSQQKKGACTDGIHCGTDDEDDETSSQQKKGACTDGIHCGTDDEDVQISLDQKKTRLTDGINCGTDDEESREFHPNVNFYNEKKEDIHDSLKKEDIHDSLKQDPHFLMPSHSNQMQNKMPYSDEVYKRIDDEVARQEKVEFKEKMFYKVDEASMKQSFSTSNHYIPESKSHFIEASNNSAFSTPNNKLANPFAETTNYESLIDSSSKANAFDRSLLDNTSRFPNTLKQSGTSPQLYSNMNPSRFSFVMNDEKFAPRNTIPIPPSLPEAVTSSTPRMPSTIGNSLSSQHKHMASPLFADGTADGLHNLAGMQGISPFVTSATNGGKPGFPESLLHQGTTKWIFSNASTSPSMNTVKDSQHSNSPVPSTKSATSESPFHSINSKLGASTTSLPKSPFSPSSSPVPKPNIISLHPGSPQYHQIFIYQHQLLIMQFQQYQFQLQVQYQQLSQQQMAPQQQYLLQQQFHQQMMLLQQQFMQQQGQLHRMAANGIQFTEHQLNAMVQQQMLTQQNYRQWVMALSPEQQIHLQQRMQASMQQVQHQMTQIMQHARVEEEQKKKPKPRRLNKKKSASNLPVVTTEPELNQPKFPVPELSDEMKRARSSIKQSKPPSIPIEPLMSSMTMMTSDQQIINNQMIPKEMTKFTAPPQKPQISKLMTPSSTVGLQKAEHTSQLTQSIKSPTIKSPYILSPEDVLSGKKKNDPLSASSSGGITPSRYENIQESFLKQQQLVKEGFGLARNEMKAAKQKAEKSLNTGRNIVIQNSRQAFFPADARFPMHPSQILSNAKNQTILKPNMHIKSPTMESIRTSNSIPLPPGETPSFGSRNNLNLMSVESMKKINPQQQLQQASLPSVLSSSSITSSTKPPVAQSNFLHSSVTSTPNNTSRSSFSVTDLLSNSSKSNDSMSVIKPTYDLQHSIPVTVNHPSVTAISHPPHAGINRPTPAGISHLTASMNHPPTGMNHPPPAGMNHPPPAGMNHPPPAGIDHPPPVGINHPPAGMNHATSAIMSHPPPAGINHPPSVGINHPSPAGINHPQQQHAATHGMLLNNQQHLMTNHIPSNSEILQQSQDNLNLSERNELLKKNLLKPPKIRKDTKLLEEKKRLREIERQKKKDEKVQQRILKEQKKAERLQQRLVKQKALQEAKLQAVKKRTKVATIPIPDMPSSDKTLSPTTLPFIPKSPPVPVTPKIPLCEPEVHLVYPLAQPVGYSVSNKNKQTDGTYGSCKVLNIDDDYAEITTNQIESLTPPDFLEVSQIECDTNLFSNQLTNHNFIPEPPDDDKSLNHQINDDSRIDQDIKNQEDEIKTETDEENNIVQNEFMNLLRCNQCFESFSNSNSCWVIDKTLDIITEINVDFNEISASDHLAFCTQTCVVAFQGKVEFNLSNEDFDLIDAVKTVAMVTLDESHTFLPLPNERGEIFAQGMNITKLNEETRNARWKRWSFQTTETKKTKRHRLSKEDMDELMARFDVRLRPNGGIKDNRLCMLCSSQGDGGSSLQSRLLNHDVNLWVHLNCALWSTEVYEALNGGLHNVDKAYMRSQYTKCGFCDKLGATLHCSQTFGAQQRLHCEKTYHFLCAQHAQCKFFKDKTILCQDHVAFGNSEEELRTFSVRRKVYVERNITKQIVRMLSLNNDLERKEYTFRVGNLIFHELGQIPLDMLGQFSAEDFVYPIGFETTSIYWDYTTSRKRRYYTCSIYERFRTPRFKVKVHSNGSEGIQYTGCTAKGAWEEIVCNIKKLREKESLLKIFPEFLCGEDLFGLSESTIQRIIESLPGIHTISSYNFRFGRTPILIAQLPLALNPTGCIRSEKFRKHHSNRPLAIRHASDHQDRTQEDPVIADESWLTYSQRTIHSTKSGQYRRMRQEWRNNVVLGRSRIQGLGLFVKKEIDENTFVIEYIGAMIRNEVANRLEGTYERQNRGIYMFRIDSDVVVDATMTGGPARYINHSCDPNCVAEIVSIEKDKKIIIISSRRIEKGEELTYDYKFEFEDDSSKIACLCGAVNCRKWMN